MAMKSCRAERSLIALFLKARCEEDMDFFREVMYTLLGLVMNLCLQSPFVYEVQPSFLPAGSPGTSQAHAIARTALIPTKRVAWGFKPWQQEWGMLDRCSVTLLL